MADSDLSIRFTLDLPAEYVGPSSPGTPVPAATAGTPTSAGSPGRPVNGTVRP